MKERIIDIFQKLFAILALFLAIPEPIPAIGFCHEIDVSGVWYGAVCATSGFT